jgi:hypothetical protein
MECAKAPETMHKRGKANAANAAGRNQTAFTKLLAASPAQSFHHRGSLLQRIAGRYQSGSLSQPYIPQQKPRFPKLVLFPAMAALTKPRFPELVLFPAMAALTQPCFPELCSLPCNGIGHINPLP